MTLTFQPTTALKTSGRIWIKSPAWYLRETVGQEGINSDLYAESLINYDAEVFSDQVNVVS
jgi:hypothetical protein